MPAQVEIDAATHKIVITAANMDSFLALARQPAVKGLDGEKLVAAIQRVGYGHLQRIERFKDGKPEDGPAGEPAVMEYFRPDGGVSMVARYKDGKLNDTPDWPALTELYDDFRVKAVKRFKNGVANDGINGEPAVEEFRETGVKRRQLRYRDGQLQDSPSGEPAQLDFSHLGGLSHAVSYDQGKILELRAALVDALQVTRDREIAQKIEEAVPALKFRLPKP